ncbi:MAG: NUDIX hydrolase [Candidatus Izemoplasmatales bacterium]
MIIEIFGDGLERRDIANQPRRVSCRGVVLKDERILVVHSDGLDVTTLPGGGREADESLSACVEREIREETGEVVRAIAEGCIVIEYFVDSIWETHYFRCEPTGATVTRALTVEEREKGCEPSWIGLYDFLALLEGYESENPYGANIHERELVGLMNTLD